MRFQVDIVAKYSMIGSKGYAELNFPQLQQSDCKLTAYGDFDVPVRGELNVSVCLNDEIQNNLKLIVIDVGNGNNIFGIDWIYRFNLYIGKKVDENKVSLIQEPSI